MTDEIPPIRQGLSNFLGMTGESCQNCRQILRRHSERNL
jgi:hypothetical protein